MNKYERVLRDFEDFIRLTASGEGRESSIQTHLKNVGILIEHFGLPLGAPTPEDIKRVLSKRLLHKTPHYRNKSRNLTKGRISNNTFNSTIQALRYWLKFHEIDPSEKSYHSLLRTKKREARKVKTAEELLTPELVQDVIDYHHWPVWKAFTAVLWDTGARPTELRMLDYEDVTRDPHGFILHIKESKSKSRSLRLLTPLGLNYFTFYYTQHPTKKGPLFLNRAGKRFSNSSVLMVYSRASEALGFKIWATLFRKSASTHWKRVGLLNDTAIRVRLGHAPWSKTFERHYHQYYNEDYEQAELAALGVMDPSISRPERVQCWNCGLLNEVSIEKCPNCHQPQNERAVVESTKVLDLEERIRQLEELVRVQTTLAREMPELLKTGEIIIVSEEQLRKMYAGETLDQVDY